MADALPIAMINGIPVHVTKLAMVPEKDANEKTIGWAPGYIMIEGKICIHPDVFDKFIVLTED